MGDRGCRAHSKEHLRRDQGRGREPVRAVPSQAALADDRAANRAVLSEEDDDAAIRESYQLANAQANEMLNRRVDIEDVVSAHLRAIERAREVGFGRYIISATTPFSRDNLAELRRNAPAAVHRLFPDCEAIFAARGWKLFPSIDRVYVNRLAMAELAWRPKYDFRHVLDCLRAGKDFRSPLARDIGSKGYRATVFERGPYPVA
jgi:UDP-glucose 4-epimerase